jgi:hypothetical protein
VISNLLRNLETQYIIALSAAVASAEKDAQLLQQLEKKLHMQGDFQP